LARPIVLAGSSVPYQTIVYIGDQMKCDKCGTDIKSITLDVLDHFGRPIKVTDPILYMLPKRVNFIKVEGASITLAEPLLYVVPSVVSIDVLEREFTVGTWKMCIRGYTCDGSTRVEQELIGVLGKPHPDIYQLGAKHEEVF
jgi:hypothetical protein